MHPYEDQLHKNTVTVIFPNVASPPAVITNMTGLVLTAFCNDAGTLISVKHTGDEMKLDYLR